MGAVVVTARNVPARAAVAASLRADQVAAVVTNLQRSALDRGDVGDHELLVMVRTWLNETSAMGASADRALRQNGVTVPEAVALAHRVRQGDT